MKENNLLKTKSPLLVFLASLLWASDTPFRQPLLKANLGVGFIGMLEHLLNTVASLPALIRHRAKFALLTKKQWLGFLYVGAGASALGALLFVKGAVAMNYNFSVALLLQKLQPIFAILLAVIFLKEKLNPKFWLLTIPALLGAYLVTFGISSPYAIWHTGSSVGLVGPLLATFAALLWAGGTVVGRSLLLGLEFEFVNAMRFLFGLIFLCFYVLYFEKMQFFLMTPLLWRNTIVIALLTGFFALLLYYYGLKNTKASVATLMELGYPLLAVVINWKFLGVALTIWQIVGGIILLLSVTVLVLFETKES